MRANTLVTHKKISGLGIGLVVREYLRSAEVSFGEYDVVRYPTGDLEVVDTFTPRCKTISLEEFKTRVLKDNSTLVTCIVGNQLKEYTGIGWITLRIITMEDLKKYPRVV